MQANEVSVTADERQIVVPSMGTIADIFLSHQSTLYKLKRQIELLKQAANMQRDHEVAWNHVDEILVTLKNSLDYLTL